MLLSVKRQDHAAFQNHQHIQRTVVARGGFVGLQYLYVGVRHAHPAGESHLLNFTLQNRAARRQIRSLCQQGKAVIDPVALTKIHKLAYGESASDASGGIQGGGVVHAVFCTGNGINGL